MRGYDYQAEATVWLALHLIFERKAPHVIIEPAPHADLEAVPAEEASSVVRPEPARFLFQIKYRGSAWSGSTPFRNIIEPSRQPDAPHSRRRSPTPVEQLAANPSLHYVLITNGQFASGAREFVILSLEHLPRKVPGTNLLVPEGASSEEIASRIGIMEQLTQSELAARLRRLFANPQVALFVPATRFDEALKLLKQDVHARLVGDRPLKWAREDIIARLRDLGGAPTRTLDMDDFEPPRGYDQLAQRLARENRLLLKGPPGAGKTLVADMLAFKLRTAEPPFEVVQANSPGDIRQRLHQEGPFLFLVDDPWGQDSRTPEKGWATQLPELFRRVSGPAGSAHKLLVTTRMGLLGEVYARRIPPELDGSSATLDYESYDSAARLRILERKSKALQSLARRQFVRKNRQEIIETLKVPLSIDRFVFAVGAAPPDSELDLAQLLHDAEVEELSGTLARELRGMDWALLPAVFLWTQFCVSAACDTDRARMRAQRFQWQPQKPLQLQKLVDWMVEAGWLRRNERRLSAHPTTVTGLERLLDFLPDEADHLVGELLEQLCASNEVQAAYALADRLPDARRASVPQTVATTIQQHLLEELLRTSPTNFVEVLHAARRWMPEGGPLALLIDALIHPPQRENAGWWELSWSPPYWPPSAYDIIRASSEARQVLERYIRLWPMTASVMMHESGFVDWTSRFGWDLSQLYWESLKEALDSGGHAVGELAHGAMSGPAPADEALLDRILMASDQFQQDDEPSELQVKASQGILDDAYADYLLIGDGTPNEAAHTALEGWMAARRKREGYSWILTHPKRSRLYWSWSRAMLDGNPPPDEEEVEAFLAIGKDAFPEKAWRIIAERQFTRFAPRMVEALGTLSQESIEPCLEALSRLISALELGTALRRQSPGWSEEQKALVVLVAQGLAEWSSEEKKPYRDEVSAAMGDSLAHLVERCARTAKDKNGLQVTARLSTEDCARLRRWAQQPEEQLGKASLLTLAASGESVLVEAEHALAQEHFEARTTAIQALSQDASPAARGLLLRALSDGEARVRVAAVHALAPGASLEEQQALLQSARDESSYVRDACVQVIARERWDAGREALVALLRDVHDRGPGVEEHVNHGIARAAAKALANWKPHPPEVVDAFLRFVADGLEANTDPDVHVVVLQFLIAHNAPRVATTISSAIDSVTGQTRPSGARICLHLLQALILHLHRWPGHCGGVSVLPIAREAMNADAISAGRAMLVLGMMGAHQDTARLLEQDEHRRERALLALLGAAVTKAAPSDVAEQVLREDEDAGQFLAWARGREKATAEVWASRWRAHASLHAWLAERWEEMAGWSAVILLGGKLCLGQAFLESIKAHPRLQDEPAR
ncbi:HEAT repeat domain-containing protein [Myxococcus xanthus]|uniref:nSTAND3 domain-containing NTPase n=1 Tax=Myxococcus xanthus TaxID=34 RepID=UPI0013758263|nr:HEAT repeat domain-containing protein [Myxococcus xanthus]